MSLIDGQVGEASGVADGCTVDVSSGCDGTSGHGFFNAS